jgi:hypothetical protein
MELIKNGIKIGRIVRTQTLWVRARNYGNEVYGLTEGPYDSVIPLFEKPGKNFYDVIIRLNTDMTAVVQHWWNEWSGIWQNEVLVARPALIRIQVAGVDQYDEFLFTMQMRNTPNYVFFMSPSPGAVASFPSDFYAADPTSIRFAEQITGAEDSWAIIQKLEVMFQRSGLFATLQESPVVRLDATFKDRTLLPHQFIMNIDGTPFQAISAQIQIQAIPYYL